MSYGNNDCKVYCGNLPPDIRKRDLEDIFYKYGKVVDVDLHDRRDTPFAFVEFEDPRDVDDAVRGRDGYVFDGCRIRVEYPKSSQRGGDRGGGGGGGRGGYDRGRRGGRTNRPRGHKIVVTGLPSTGSWQDLKDHFRQAGDIIYADVQRDGTGVVEFARYEHAKRAARDMDDSKFRSHEGDTAYVRVSGPSSPPRGGGGGGGGGGGRSRSPSYSPKRGGSPRDSPRRSRSPRYEYSRHSRSRSN